MDERARVLVRLAAALTRPEPQQLEVMDLAAAVDGAAAEEVLLQSYLFLGFPVALNALGLWRRRTGRKPEPSLQESPDEWVERGERVCAAVYAHQYEALRELMQQVHPDLDRWAVMEGYGKVLGRPGLDLGTRELCVAAMLSGVEAPRQLHAHLRGCLNVGVEAGTVEEMLDAIDDLVGDDRIREARRVWERVLGRWTATTGD